MRRLSIYFVFLLITFKSFCVCAQQARYATLPEVNNIHIAGKIGKSIHVWSSRYPGSNYVNTEMNLYIYSESLKLVDNKKISLPNARINKILFKLEDSCYYAQIFYTSAGEKKLVVKVFENGTIITVSDSLLISSHQFSNRVNYSSRQIRYKNNSYFVNTQKGIEKPEDGNADKLLTGEKKGLEKQVELLTVSKTDETGSTTVKQQQFISDSFNFQKAFMTLSGENIVATAFGQKQEGKQQNKPYYDSYLFLARLDTNLSVLNNGPATLKISTENKRELFFPYGVYPIGDKILIISSGIISKTDFSYGGRNDGVSAPPLASQYYVTNSLRMMLISEKETLLADSIVKTQSEHSTIDFENIFITAGYKGVDIFCARKYTRTKNGIVHFGIHTNGIITADDMIVNAECFYNLASADSLAPGLLIVPYVYKNENGIMTVTYDHGE